MADHLSAMFAIRAGIEAGKTEDANTPAKDRSRQQIIDALGKPVTAAFDMLKDAFDMMTEMEGSMFQYTSYLRSGGILIQTSIPTSDDKDNLSLFVTNQGDMIEVRDSGGSTGIKVQDAAKAVELVARKAAVAKMLK